MPSSASTCAVLLLGRLAEPQHLIRQLSVQHRRAYHIQQSLAFADEAATLEAVERLADETAYQRDFDEIWLGFPLRQGPLVERLLQLLARVPVPVRYFPNLCEIPGLNHRLATAVEANAPPLGRAARLIKFGEDRVLGTLLFLVTLPLSLAVAGLIALCLGRPVLHKQYRHGLDGRRFKLYKFRTTPVPKRVDGAEKGGAGAARMRRLGHWLRRTGLDELPQFYNVLQGRMSLVGPRPHDVAHNAAYKDAIDVYMQRHRVKPGITGWAQVNGLRGITDDVDAMRRRVDYDLYYINHWSLGLDLKILLLT